GTFKGFRGVDDEGDDVTVADGAEEAAGDVFGGDGRGVDELDGCVFEVGHAGDGKGGGEGVVGDFDLRLGGVGNDGALSDVWRADEDDLSGAGAGDMEGVGAFLGFAAGGFPELADLPLEIGLQF